MANSPKSASVTTYLIEELGDARLRCDQLVRYINDAVKLIDKSPEKDHFFEEAGHLIEGIPATAFKLEKALQAVALAATKLDYEELKQELRPEKVQQLEKVLEEARIRPVHRRSEPIMDVQQAIEALQKLASQTRESGLPTTEVLGLITDLEAGSKKASEEPDPATSLDRIARALSSATPEQKLSRVRLAGLLRRLVADELIRELTSEEPLTKEAAEEVVSPEVLVEEMLSAMKMVARSAGVGRWRVALLQLTGIVEGIGTLLAQMGDEGALQKTRALVRDVMQAARMAQRMRPEDALPVLAGDKTAVDPMRAMERMVDTTKDQLKEMEHSFGLLKRDPGKNAPQKDNFASAVNSLMSAGRMVQRALGKTASEDEEKQSRFEEGKPADPTRNMGKDDAAKWKAMNREHGDKFKKEAALDKELLKRYQLEVDTSIESLKSARKTPKNPKRHFSTALQSMGNALAQLEPEGEGPASEAVFKAADKMNQLRPVTDFVKKEAVGGDPADLAHDILEEGENHPAIKEISKDWDKEVVTAIKKAQKEHQNLHRFGVGSTEDVTLVNAHIVPALKSYLKTVDLVADQITARLKRRMASDPWKVDAAEDEEKEARFEEGKPADPTKQMSPEDAKKWKSNTDKYEDKFKGASEEEEAKESRFEEGKPADPTKNMSPEDAKKWKDHVDEDGSNIKNAADPWKVEAALRPVDKKVVDAFYEKKQAEGKVLITDGKKLETLGLGSAIIAEWRGSKIELGDDTGTRYEDSVIRYMKKSIPKNTFGPDPRLASEKDEEKQSRFEEGKPADPTKQMSPEDAKKWKSNTDKYEDKFKGAASSMDEGKWYMQSFQTTGDIYFYAQEQLKNKGLKGLMVAIGDSGRAQKAKKDSVSPSNFKLWKEVSESSVPSDVKLKAHARMASSDPWKVESEKA